jgi:hypothetical protein
MKRKFSWPVRNQKLELLLSLNKKISNPLLKKYIGNKRCFVFAFSVLPFLCYAVNISFRGTATCTPDWLVRKNLVGTVAPHDRDACSAQQMTPSKRTDVCENG